MARTAYNKRFVFEFWFSDSLPLSEWTRNRVYYISTSLNRMIFLFPRFEFVVNSLIEAMEVTHKLRILRVIHFSKSIIFEIAYLDTAEVTTIADKFKATSY